MKGQGSILSSRHWPSAMCSVAVAILTPASVIRTYHLDTCLQGWSQPLETIDEILVCLIWEAGSRLPLHPRVNTTVCLVDSSYGRDAQPCASRSLPTHYSQPLLEVVRCLARPPPTSFAKSTTSPPFYARRKPRL